MLNEPQNDELLRVLVHAGADSVLSRSGGAEKPNIEDLTARATEVIAALEPAEAAALLSRLQLYETLLSKDARRETREGDTPLAHKARAIQQDVRRVIDSMLGNETTSIQEATHTAITTVVELDERKPLSSEELYQQLIGEDFEQIKTIAGKPKADKWIDLVAPVFTQGKAIDVLNHAGFIPYQLYTSNTFRKNVQFSHLSGLHRQLRDREERVDGVALERTLHARAQLLCHVFLQEKAEGIGGKVTLDTNGLWVNLEDRRKKSKEPDRLVGHIPYSYIDEPVIQALLQQERIQESDALELRLRHAEATNDVAAMEALEWEKVMLFLKLSGLGERERFKGQSKEKILDELIFEVLIGYDFELKKAHKENIHLYIPFLAVRHSLNRQNIESVYKLKNILYAAESIQTYIAREPRTHEGYESYNLSDSATKSYEARKSILQDPRNYDAPRLVGFLLETKDALEIHNSPKFNMFRGTISEREGRSSSFIEMIIEGGSICRVLLDPEKQLTARQQELFSELPVLNKDEYELFETLGNTYAHHSQLARNLHIYDGPRFDYMMPDELRQLFLKSMAEMNAFLLMEDPSYYARAIIIYNEFLEGHSYFPSYEFFSICDNAVEKFGERLFNPVHTSETLQRYTVDIQRHKVTFDDAFVNEFPDRFKEKSWTWDASLCAELRELNYSITVVDAGDRAIPYAMEAKAIRSLRLLQDRPLISVIGGCRDMPNEGTTKSAVEEMCEGIMQAADTLTANVVPPGTQSGIGISLGKVSVAYNQQTADRSPAKKARFFAVSPGGETYYPGNAQMADASEDDAMVYAIGPFDSILTPFEAGWDWKDDRKRDAPYFQHVEYAEAIYQRVSAGQPRVTVVGNGGLFTVVEAAAALKNHASILLIADTGRFADLAIALETHRAELSDIDKKAWEQKVLDVILSDIPTHSTKALVSAFGEAAPTAEQQLYRDKVFEYFRLGKGEDIRIGGVTTVEQDIEKIVMEKREKSGKKSK